MENNKLLLYFSEHGNCNLVKLLIPVSDPKANIAFYIHINQINKYKVER